MRESAAERQTQKVKAGNLLRVGDSPAAKRPGWSTAPPLVAPQDDSLDPFVASLDRRLMPEEIDELNSSSPMPGPSPAPQVEEDSNIASPLDSSPPPVTSRADRKRKEPPSPPTTRQGSTPSKPLPGQKPISAHSPARLNLVDPRARSGRVVKQLPPPPPIVAPARALSRGNSRAKKQKVEEESPDSFAGIVPRKIEKASMYFERLLSSNEEMAIPREMQTASTGGMSENEDEHKSGDDNEEDDDMQGGEGAGAREGADMEEVDGSMADSSKSGIPARGSHAEASGDRHILIETYINRPGMLILLQSYCHDTS